MLGGRIISCSLGLGTAPSRPRIKAGPSLREPGGGVSPACFAPRCGDTTPGKDVEVWFTGSDSPGTDFLEYTVWCPPSLAGTLETWSPRSCDRAETRSFSEPSELPPVSPGPQRPCPRWTPANHELAVSSRPSLGRSGPGCGRTWNLRGLRVSTCPGPHDGPRESDLGGKLQGPVHPLCYRRSTV